MKLGGKIEGENKGPTTRSAHSQTKKSFTSLERV
jgi:hypothetical protein